MSNSQPPTETPPSTALASPQRAEIARLAAAIPPSPGLVDLSVAQRLDPGSLILLSRLSSGSLGSQMLLQGDPASNSGKLIAADYLAATSPTLASLAPLFARADYTEADLLYLLAAHSAKNAPLNDAVIEDALLSSRSPLRRFLLWIKVNSSIWPD